MGVLLLVSGQRAKKLGRSGTGDRTEIGNRLLAGQPDAVVLDRDRAGRGIRVHANLELGLAAEQRRLCDRGKAQSVVRIGCVRDELAQENIPVTVQGVNHQFQQIPDFRLEAVSLFLGLWLGILDCGRHDRLPLWPERAILGSFQDFSSRK